MARPKHSVVIPWWANRGRALVWYAAVCVAGLIYFAARAGQFQAVHRGLMVTFAAALVYFIAVRTMNVTRMFVREDRLVVEHGPLPWAGRVVIPLADVDRLGVDPAAHRLRLRTARGEDVALVDDIIASAASRLDADLASLISQDEPES